MSKDFATVAAKNRRLHLENSWLMGFDSEDNEIAESVRDFIALVASEITAGITSGLSLEEVNTRIETLVEAYGLKGQPNAKVGLDRLNVPVLVEALRGRGKLLTKADLPVLFPSEVIYSTQRVDIPDDSFVDLTLDSGKTVTENANAEVTIRINHTDSDDDKTFVVGRSELTVSGYELANALDGANVTFALGSTDTVLRLRKSSGSGIRSAEVTVSVVGSEKVDVGFTQTEGNPNVIFRFRDGNNETTQTLIVPTAQVPVTPTHHDPVATIGTWTFTPSTPVGVLQRDNAHKKFTIESFPFEVFLDDETVSVETVDRSWYDRWEEQTNGATVTLSDGLNVSDRKGTFVVCRVGNETQVAVMSLGAGVQEVTLTIKTHAKARYGSRTVYMNYEVQGDLPADFQGDPSGQLEYPVPGYADIFIDGILQSFILNNSTVDALPDVVNMQGATQSNSVVFSDSEGRNWFIGGTSGRKYLAEYSNLSGQARIQIIERQTQARTDEEIVTLMLNTLSQNPWITVDHSDNSVTITIPASAIPIATSTEPGGITAQTYQRIQNSLDVSHLDQVAKVRGDHLVRLDQVLIFKSDVTGNALREVSWGDVVDEVDKEIGYPEVVRAATATELEGISQTHGVVLVQVTGDMVYGEEEYALGDLLVKTTDTVFERVVDVRGVVEGELSEDVDDYDALVIHETARRDIDITTASNGIYRDYGNGNIGTLNDGVDITESQLNARMAGLRYNTSSLQVTVWLPAGGYTGEIVVGGRSYTLSSGSQNAVSVPFGSGGGVGIPHTASLASDPGSRFKLNLSTVVNGKKRYMAGNPRHVISSQPKDRLPVPDLTETLIPQVFKNNAEPLPLNKIPPPENVDVLPDPTTRPGGAEVIYQGERNTLIVDSVEVPISERNTLQVTTGGSPRQATSASITNNDGHFLAGDAIEQVGNKVQIKVRSDLVGNNQSLQFDQLITVGFTTYARQQNAYDHDSTTGYSYLRFDAVGTLRELTNQAVSVRDSSGNALNFRSPVRDDNHRWVSTPDPDDLVYKNDERYPSRKRATGTGVFRFQGEEVTGNARADDSVVFPLKNRLPHQGGTQTATSVGARGVLSPIRHLTYHYRNDYRSELQGKLIVTMRSNNARYNILDVALDTEDQSSSSAYTFVVHDAERGEYITEGQLAYKYAPETSGGASRAVALKINLRNSFGERAYHTATRQDDAFIENPAPYMVSTQIWSLPSAQIAAIRSHGHDGEWVNAGTDESITRSLYLHIDELPRHAWLFWLYSQGGQHEGPFIRSRASQLFYSEMFRNLPRVRSATEGRGFYLDVMAFTNPSFSAQAKSLRMQFTGNTILDSAWYSDDRVTFAWDHVSYLTSGTSLSLHRL